MKVKELIKKLKKYDEEAGVYFSSDEEGNRIMNSCSLDRIRSNSCCLYPFQKEVKK